MQAQLARTEQNQDTLTAQQSLQSVETLLRAGLGCISYLRNLLPSDNFSESYLTSDGRSPSSVNGSFASDSGKRNVSGFKIMTVTRGFTEEADKLLDYLEHGVFDALQKQYLRSFIFAVYLDSQDPNNIVEAYTFNFQYYTVPGTDVSIPVMTLGDDLMKLSLSGLKPADPIANATKKGKVPTLGEVKRSLKTLIKNLIQATTQMDALPKRRFATFKLFYHDHTPDDYEPPHFRSGDAQKDKWFFSTHDSHEAPEKCSVGQVQTGWHGVDLRVASVSGYLPSAEDNNAPFCGTTDGNGRHAPPLTPAEEATARLQQMALQKQDALERNVVWDAEEGLGDIDAEAEEDAEESQILGTWKICPAGMELVGPIGMRDEDGNIVPLPDDDSTHEPVLSAEALFQGAKEKIPRHIGQLKLPAGSIECTQTQQVECTQARSSPFVPGSPLSSPAPSLSPSPTPQPVRWVTTRSEARVVLSEAPEQSPLPPSDRIESSEPSQLDLSAGTPLQETIDTQMLKEAIISRQAKHTNEDTEMLDMNTQMPSFWAEDDSIRRFASQENASLSQPDAHMAEKDVLECECGICIEDCDWLSCDGNCKRWFHSWCMGFHSGTDARLPETFVCFDCRVRADQNWDLIMVHDLYPHMMEKFRDLAFFRRAIKICETRNPETQAAFTKLIGCESIVAGQLFKRLEAEGFIALEVMEQDDLGLMETSTRSAKNKSKKPKNRRNPARKPKYKFVNSVVHTKGYQDYFDPSPEVEKRVLSLADLNPKRRSQRKRSDNVRVEQNMAMGTMYETPPGPQGNTETSQTPLPPPMPQIGSQTQLETQLMLETQEETDPADLKRKTSASSDEASRKKKIKISIGPAVDLGD